MLEDEPASFDPAAFQRCLENLTVAVQKLVDAQTATQCSISELRKELSECRQRIEDSPLKTTDEQPIEVGDKVEPDVKPKTTHNDEDALATLRKLAAFGTAAESFGTEPQTKATGSSSVSHDTRSTMATPATPATPIVTAIRLPGRADLKKTTPKSTISIPEMGSHVTPCSGSECTVCDSYNSLMDSSTLKAESPFSTLSATPGSMSDFELPDDPGSSPYFDDEVELPPERHPYGPIVPNPKTSPMGADWPPHPDAAPHVLNPHYAHMFGGIPPVMSCHPGLVPALNTYPTWYTQYHRHGPGSPKPITIPPPRYGVEPGSPGRYPPSEAPASYYPVRNHLFSNTDYQNRPYDPLDSFRAIQALAHPSDRAKQPQSVNYCPSGPATVQHRQTPCCGPPVSNGNWNSSSMGQHAASVQCTSGHPQPQQSQRPQSQALAPPAPLLPPRLWLHYTEQRPWWYHP